MRYSLLTVLALSVIIAGCAQQTAEKTETETTTEAVEFNLTGAPTVEFAVSGMTCEAGCASKVHEILAGQPGVVDAKVDFPAERATVAIETEAFDAQAALAALADYQFEGKLLDDAAAPAISEPAEETDVPPVATPGSES